MAIAAYITGDAAIRAVAPPSGGEESPDCIEQGVLLIKKDTADDTPREGKCNREQTARMQIRVRVKGWGKSPPGE